MMTDYLYLYKLAILKKFLNVLMKR